MALSMWATNLCGKMKPYHRWVFLKCVLNLGIIWVCVLESGRCLYDSHFSLWKRTHKLGCSKIRAYLGKFSKIISNKFYIIVLSLNSFDFKHFIVILSLNSFTFKSLNSMPFIYALLFSTLPFSWVMGFKGANSLASTINSRLP